MMKKWITALAVTVLSVSLLAGCGNSDKKTDERSEQDKSAVVVTMPVSSEPESGFDPAYGWGAGEHTHEPLIQSTLTVTDENMEIAYDLATDIKTSEDGLSWTVTIRNDVVFSDGEPLTASDVAFTYNTVKELSTVTDVTMLDEAVAVDDETVEFHMNTAYSIWPYTMAYIGIVPEHAYDEGYGLNPIGSGPYMMKQWDKGQQVIFEANPNYYGEEPAIKKLTVLFMDESSALAAAMAGQVDVAHTAATYADQSIDGYEIERVASVDNRGFNLPTIPAEEKNGVTVGNDFTCDVNVRRAINLAIDREEMIEHVLSGYGSAAYSVCDAMPWYSEENQVSYDPDEAVRLLEEAGWVMGSDGIREKNGIKATFTLMFHPDDSVRQALAEDTANQLREIGILVTTEGAGWDVAYDRALSQPLMWGWGAHTPMEFYNIYHSTQSGLAMYSPYANETVDQYMDEALKAASLEESYELWKKAQWDGTTGVSQKGDIPWIWLCNVDHLYFVRDGLDIGEQKLHPHGHGWSLVNNVEEWKWS